MVINKAFRRKVYMDIFFKDILSLTDNQIKKKYLYLGEGIARKVYAINDNFVIKVAKGIDGYFQNNVENYIFETVDSNLLKYLCPIVAFNPRIIVMKRAKPLSTHKQNRINLSSVRTDKDSTWELNYLAKKYYLYYNDILSASSWGNYKGENVLIDYGCANEQGDRYYGRLFHM
jgi:hypothetical protein